MILLKPLSAEAIILHKELLLAPSKRLLWSAHYGYHHCNLTQSINSSIFPLLTTILSQFLQLLQSRNAKIHDLPKYTVPTNWPAQCS